MRAIKRINNNAAICVDGKGRELIALGNGIGFGDMPRDVELSNIKRTFYGIDSKYLALVEELDPLVLEFSAQLADLVRAQVSHELSPNLPVTLADHIAFAIKRAQEHMIVRMPLSYDVQQQYPVEYGLAKMAVAGVNKTFGVRLPPSEASGIALSIINSATAASAEKQRAEKREERIVEKAVAIIEHGCAVTVDRDSFDFARFATHVRYLLERVASGEPLDTGNANLYPVLLEQYPQSAACADKIANVIEAAYGVGLTEEEKVYLILHVTRVAERTTARG